MEYKVVTECGDSVPQAIKALTRSVYENIKMGYKLKGGASITRGRGDVYIVMQTMVKGTK